MSKENTSFFFPFSFIIFLSSLFLINLQPVSCLRLTLLFTCRLRLPLGGEDVPFLFIDDDEVKHLFLWGGSAWTTQLPVRNGSFCDVISGLILPPPFLRLIHFFPKLKSGERKKPTWKLSPPRWSKSIFIETSSMKCLSEWKNWKIVRSIILNKYN